MDLILNDYFENRELLEDFQSFKEPFQNIQNFKGIQTVEDIEYFKYKPFTFNNSIINYFIVVAGLADGVTNGLIFLAKLANLMPKFNLNTG